MNADKSKSDDVDNYVFLRGRLADEMQQRELPSGDVLAMFRLTVDRPAGDRGSVDSLECVSTRARVRTSIGRLEAGTVVEVTGSLRRRFWRGAHGVESRYAVEVTSAAVSRGGRAPRADQPAVASRSRKPASA